MSQRRHTSSSRTSRTSSAQGARRTRPRAANASSQRRQPLSHAPKRKSILVPVMIVCACLVAVVYGTLYFSNVFAVHEVDVEGVEHLTAEEMTALTSVPADTTLLRIDKSAIKERILKDAWVQDVKIKKRYPSTLVLDILERKMAATVEIYAADGIAKQIWALSSDSMWLCEIPERDSERAQTMSDAIFRDADEVLRISDVKYGAVAESGVMCTDESILNALAIVDGLSTELKDDIISLKAASPESTTAILSSNVEIVFGTSEDLRDKERICLQVLQENEGKVSYINVSVPEKPTWRSIE
ncbi:MAG: FtsQ-type POTRA domain-containing protein [Eggerthellaceae bacterium]|nr:FtsQ-type POTRA domain-containing protein [Eggerthellaceae bacterium]